MHCLAVGYHQLQVHGLYIALWIDAAVLGRIVHRLETSYYVQQCVNVFNVGERPCAVPWFGSGVSRYALDVHYLHGGRNSLSGVI